MSWSRLLSGALAVALVGPAFAGSPGTPAATEMTDPAPVVAKRGGLSLAAVQRMVTHLEQTVRGLKPPRGKTEWDDYYQANHNYEGAALAEKERLVRTALEASRPQSVWDLINIER